MNLADTKDIITFIERAKRFGIQGEYYIVGSILYKRVPRDFDLLLVISDIQFEKMFCKVDRFEREGEMGKWTKTGRYKWNDKVIEMVKAGRDIDIHAVDFKIYPRSLLKKPNLRIA